MRGVTVMKIGLALLVLLAVLVTLSPLAARYFGARWMQEQGVADADIEAVSMNFLSGIITVEGVVAGSRPGQTLRLDTLTIDPGWGELLSGRLAVDNISLTGAVVDVQRQIDGSLTIGELAIAAAPEASPDAPPAALPSFAVGAIELASITVSFSDQNFSKRFHLDELNLGSISTEQPGSTTSIALAGRFEETNLNVSGKLLPLAAARELDLEITLRNLLLAEHRDVMPTSGIENLAGRISLTTDLRLVLGDDGIEVDVSGQVTAADLRASLGAIDLAVDDMTIDLSARVTERGGLEYNVQAGGEANAISAGIRDKPGQLLRVGKLAITGADISTANVSVNTIVGTDIVLLEQYHEAGNTIDRLALSGLAATLPVGAAPAVVEIDDVTMTGASFYIARSAENTILYAELPTDLGAAAPKPAEDAGVDEPSGPAIIRVRRIGIEAASVAIRDSRVQPPLVVTLAPVTLELENFDSSQLETPVLANLVINLGEFTRINAAGLLVPLADKPGADLTFEVAGLELPQFAAYLPGYDIARGRLNVTGKAVIDSGKLNVTNDLLLEDLQLAAKAGKEVPALSNALAMPLDVALDLLRNSKDEIQLSIPVTGDVSSPKFDFDDVISSAIGGAMQKAAFSYAKSLLQPLGTILFVADIAGKASRPRFEPVAFDPGSAALTDKGREYLVKVAGLLTDRPGLRISVCGVASPTDSLALQQLKQAEVAAMVEPAAPDAESGATATAPPITDAELVDLANRRGELVRSTLITGNGLAQSRVFSCGASVETSDDPGPRAKLLL